MSAHDALCPIDDPLTRACECALIARVRADAIEMEAHRALKARDRCRLNSDAWSRLDRFACDMFGDARAIRGGAPTTPPLPTVTTTTVSTDVRDTPRSIYDRTR